MGEEGKIVIWFVFTVLVSLVPFVMVALNMWSDDKAVQLVALWPHGELLLVSTALAANAVGDLIPTRSFATRTKIVAAGSCIVLLIVAALWYAMIQGHPEFKLEKISEGSITLFVFTLIASGSCKLLAER
jgi:hypothetical protein